MRASRWTFLREYASGSLSLSIIFIATWERIVVTGMVLGGLVEKRGDGGVPTHLVSCESIDPKLYFGEGAFADGFYEFVISNESVFLFDH